MEQRIIDLLLKHRYILAVLSILAVVLLASGTRLLYLDTDYRIYFNDDDPMLLAHEDIEQTYTKSDSLGILLKPEQGTVFTQRYLQAIFEITEASWQSPYVSRVDSLTNFQHTYASNDDLVVEDLVLDPSDLSDSRIAEIQRIALSEKQVVKRLVSQSGETSLVNISLELPPSVDTEADAETQAQQKIELDETNPVVIAFGNKLVDEFQRKYPELEFHLVGVVAINNSFDIMSLKDGKTLVPAMYGVIVLLLAVFLRSFGTILAAIVLIGFSSVSALGAAGWLGFTLNTVNIVSPTIILMIAVCDIVHLLAVYLRNLSLQQLPLDAMRESLRLNFQPIILTSVTTAVGFFTLNFSISPPFRELGTISGIGVLIAMVLTFTLLPTLILLLVRKRKPNKGQELAFSWYVKFVTNNKVSVMFGTGLVAVILMALIPLNVIDDNPSGYFKPSVPYRDANDFQEVNLPAINDINFSLSCGEPGCVNSPEYLEVLVEFNDWVVQQTGVEHVSTYADIIKRLNKSMNGDAAQFYSIPPDGDLTAQYNLLYEMSLPYGLDLNNQLNIDKSASRVTIFTRKVSTGRLLEIESDARQWLEQNAPELASPGASVLMMFANIGERNVRSMAVGAVFAIIGVTITILIALRSFRYALLSLIPNVLPALMAFGVWGLLVGQVNMAVAAVFSICLGILVDDTVHFISKYRRAREQKGLSPEQSIEYAFNNVGSALIITTLVLVLGFSLLNLSDFNLNAMTGSLTSLTIAIALVFDFLILPPLLLMFDKDDT